MRSQVNGTKVWYETRMRLLILLLAFPLVAHAAGPLDGKWEQLSFTCEGGKLDALTKLALGEPKRHPTPRLEIWGEVVKTVLRGKGGCEYHGEENWKITDTTYLILSSKAAAGSSCELDGKQTLTGVAHHFEVKDGTLRLLLDFPKPEKPGPRLGRPICEDGTIVATYRKLAK